MNYIKRLIRVLKGEKSIPHPEDSASTKSVMTQIYAHKKWGGKNLDFYSGAGSHSKKIIEPYLQATINFLQRFNSELVICDLGCGDFNVGQALVPYTRKYIGIDVVEELIMRNKRKFTHKNLEFHCLDIVNDRLPNADCVIVRQVLQHLSNEEIGIITNKLAHYDHLIITEHWPGGNFEANLDKPTGAGIRTSINSGVVLTEPPFNLQSEKTEILADVAYRGDRIVTIHYKIKQ